MDVTKTSHTGLQAEVSSQEQTKKNILEAIGFIKHSKLNNDDKNLADLLDSIKSVLVKVKKLKLIDEGEISLHKLDSATSQDKQFILKLPKALANSSSFLVYRSLLGYFLNNAKKQTGERFRALELDDFTSVLKIENKILPRYLLIP